MSGTRGDSRTQIGTPPPIIIGTNPPVPPNPNPGATGDRMSGTGGDSREPYPSPEHCPYHQDGSPCVMRCRSAAEMDELVRQAGFRKTRTLLDSQGMFSVNLATTD